MTSRAYTIVDVFTDTPLQGNLAAVFTDGRGLDGELMQRTARELNLSETVFVLPPSPGSAADAGVRIFTPASELPFAGHPVLGTAFVLAASRPDTERITLETGAGLVPIALRRKIKPQCTARWTSRSRRVRRSATPMPSWPRWA